MKTFIGCSGYSYNDWKESFYPDELPKDQWLSFYAEKFNTVEINHSFYKFPEEAITEKWLDQTPADFRFSIKGHRFFTHLKKFTIDDAFMEKLDSFQASLTPLKDKISCILWQLPGNLHKNIPKLDSFCQKLDMSFSHVFEFRHQSWFDDEVYELMKKNNVAFCILSAPGNLPEDLIVTNKTAYVRFHGKSNWYDYLYSDKELKDWKKRLSELKDINQIFIYFNNDQDGNAVKNALTIKDLLKA